MCVKSYKQKITTSDLQHLETLAKFHATLRSAHVLSRFCSVFFCSTEVPYEKILCQGSSLVRANIYINSGVPDSRLLN